MSELMVTISYDCLNGLRGQLEGSQQELTSIRNQLAEVQIKAFDSGINSIAKERDQLNQKLDEALLANKNANGQIGELSNQLTEKYAALLACELSRERMRVAIQFPELTAGNADAIAYHAERGEQNGGISLGALCVWFRSIARALREFDAAKNELPQTTLTEALKGMRSLIKEAIHSGGMTTAVCNLLQQALSELDKLCAK